MRFAPSFRNLPTFAMVVNTGHLMKGQSLHHICINHADEIMIDERTLYSYVDKDPGKAD